MKVLLVTISIGEKYIETYNKLFRESQEKYAVKNGYDFKMITEHLDPTYGNDKISMYFQKVLVCSQDWSAKYDYIIYIDSDVYININSPPIHNHCEFGDLIGVVDEMCQPTYDYRMFLHWHWKFADQSVPEYYALADFTLDTKIAFNSGVIVFQPKKHREYLETYYNTYLPKSIGHSRYPFYEQTALSYVLLTTNMYKSMTTKFNAIWNYTKMKNEIITKVQHKPGSCQCVLLKDYFKENYFIHFAGVCDFDKVPSLDQFNKDDNDNDNDNDIIYY